MFLSTLLAFTAIYLLYWYLTSPYKTWRRRNIPGPEPKFFEGNFKSYFSRKCNVMDDFMTIYDKYRGKEPIVGIYVLRHPQLMVLEPEVVKDILIKHQRKFGENFFATVMSPKDKIFGPNLFFMHNQPWKIKRQELIPGFAVNKLKAHTDNMHDIALDFCKYIKKITKHQNSSCFDVKSLTIRYTAEVSSSIVFGLKANSFVEDEPAIMAVSCNLIPFAEDILAYFRRIYLFPFWRKIRKTRLSGVDTQSFFEGLSVDALKLRQNERTVRNDYVDHLLQLMKKKGLSEKEMTGDFLNQFLDAFETTSVFLTYVLYEIARHKDVQERLRTEIKELEGKFDFESMESLQYLDQVVYEALRLHPVLVNLVKICTAAYRYTSEDGTQSVVIEKGDIVNVPIYCIQRDPLTFENRSQFDPDRFSAENGGVKKFRQMCSLIPFGEGPRQCLGMRYSLAEVKIAIIELIQHFDMTLNQQTQTPLTMIPDSMMYLAMPNPVWIDFHPL